MGEDKRETPTQVGYEHTFPNIAITYSNSIMASLTSTRDKRFWVRDICEKCGGEAFYGKMVDQYDNLHYQVKCKHCKTYCVHRNRRIFELIKNTQWMKSPKKYLNESQPRLI